MAKVMHDADCPALENDDAEFEYEDGHMQCVECGAVDPDQDDDVWLEGMLRTGHAGEV